MTWTNIRAFLFNLDLEPNFSSYIWLFFDQLDGILMDTGNLTSPHCTTKDKYMLLCYSTVLVALDPMVFTR